MKAIADVFKKIRTIYSKRQQMKFCFVFFLIVISGFLELIGISLILPFINVVINPEIIMTNKYLNFVYNLFHITDTTNFLIFLAFILIAVYIFKNLYMLIVYFFQYKILYNAQKDISLQLIKFYVNQPYAYHLNINTSEMVRIVTNDTSNCSNFLTHLFFLLTELIVVLLVISFLFYINKTITIVLVILFVFIFLIIFKVLKPRLKKFAKSNQKNHGMMIKWIQQSLGAIKDIKILQKENFFVDKYYDSSVKYSSAQKHYHFFEQFPRLLIESFVVSVILLVIIYLLYSGINASTIIVQMAVFAMAAFRLMPSMNRLQISLSALIYFLPSMNVVYRDLKNTRIAGYLEEDENKNLSSEKDIIINGISYKYPNTEKYIFKNVSFVIQKGKSIGFEGPTGAGKTTLIDVILGLLNPTDGTITIDGANIHKNKKSWFSKVGYVPQFIYLTDDTIRNNILFYDDENVDEEILRNVVEQAQLKEFIDSLPEGLDTIVGERGIRLSGGQRQRIGIARALYKKPEILVLDEATSALDNETEKSVMQAIEHLYGKITMLVIAHRLTTIEKCDEIYKIDKEKIIKIK
ncbi:MAG: ABC transporter ATP-binding protein [Elusimicrobia bacterium]|nr:ABC transporter ATP-binding protein [Elusimicrobiota bacterium]